MASLVRALSRAAFIDVAHQPVHAAERQYGRGKSEQLSRAAAGQIKNDQFAHNRQHRDQDDGADMNDALLTLGDDEQGSAELERDDYDENHAKNVLKDRRIRRANGAQAEQNSDHLQNEAPDRQQDDDGDHGAQGQDDSVFEAHLER